MELTPYPIARGVFRERHYSVPAGHGGHKMECILSMHTAEISVMDRHSEWMATRGLPIPEAWQRATC
jgi:hypothetical protein